MDRRPHRGAGQIPMDSFFMKWAKLNRCAMSRGVNTHMEDGGSHSSHNTSDPHIGLTIAETGDTRMDDLHRLFQEVESAYQAAAGHRYVSPAETRLRQSLQKMRACLDGDYQTLWRLSQQELEEVRQKAKRVSFNLPPGSATVTPKPVLELNTVVVVPLPSVVPVAPKPSRSSPVPALFSDTSPATEAAHTRKFVLRPLPTSLELGNPVGGFVDSPV